MDVKEVKSFMALGSSQLSWLAGLAARVDTVGNAPSIGKLDWFETGKLQRFPGRYRQEQNTPWTCSLGCPETVLFIINLKMRNCSK